MADKPNVAVTYRLNDQTWRTVSGHASKEEAVVWLRWSGVMDRALRGANGEAVTVEVVTLAAVNKDLGKQGWSEYLRDRRAEKERQAEDARQAEAARLAAEAEAARAAELERLVAEKFRADQLKKLAKWREEAEAELAQREQGEAVA